MNATSVTRVVNALLGYDELYCPFDQSGVAVAGATNSAKMRRKPGRCYSLPIFPPPSRRY